MIMTQRLPCLTLVCCSLLAPLSHAESAKLITYAKTHGTYTYVDDPASPQYRGESFVIAEGKFDPGPGDPSAHDLASVSFDEISEVLSESLFTRGFTTPAHPNDSHLVLVVHRGRTAPQQNDPRRSEVHTTSIPPGSFQSTTTPTGPYEIGSSVASTPTTSSDLADSDALVKTSRMLGFYPRYVELHQNRSSLPNRSRYNELVEELKQERFYIVIAAYDAREMRSTGRQVILWETRLSFSAEDRSFAERYDDMIAAGAPYFANNTPRTLARSFVRIN